jgi:hypothetical protein
MATVTENFDGSNTSPPSLAGIQNPWTHILGAAGTAFAILGNKARCSTNFDNYAHRCDTPAAAIHMRVGAECIISGGSGMTGVLARQDSGATFYCFLWYISVYKLLKCLGGGFSQIGADVAAGFSNGQVLEIETAGSTIKGFIGGSEVIAVTDTDITAGLHGGIVAGDPAFGGSFDTSIDNWFITDVADPGGGGGGPSPLLTVLAPSQDFRGA